MKNKRGFTLVEVLLVIVIISIITLLVMPNISDILSTGKNKKYKTIEDMVRTSLELYNIDYKEDLWSNKFSENDMNVKTYDREDANDGEDPETIIKQANPDLDLNGCVINKLKITRTGTDTFTYDVCISCPNDGSNYQSDYCKDN